MTHDVSMAPLVPAAAIVPLAFTYAFDGPLSIFGGILFGAILLFLVERTISKRLKTHLDTITALVNLADASATAVEKQQGTNENRFKRLEESNDRLKNAISEWEKTCAARHGP